MNRRKGQNYLTVFADLLAKRVLFGTPGKDASVWEAFAAELLRHNGHPKAIQYVAIDISPAYIKGVSDHLGNAQVCTISSMSSRMLWRRATKSGRSRVGVTPGSGICWNGRVGCG